MKKQSILILITIALLTACAPKPENALIGKWQAFDGYYGITQLEFKKDKTITKRFYNGLPDYDSQVNGHYTVIDGVLFISFRYDDRDMGYNYFFYKNHLVLSSGEFGNITYDRVKKTNKTAKDSKKMLIGQWKLPEYDYKVKLTFTEDNLNIKGYDDKFTVIWEENHPYEITERSITIKNIDREKNKDNNFYNRKLRINDYLYTINKDNLILKGYNTESGLISSMFLLKVKKD